MSVGEADGENPLAQQESGSAESRGVQRDGLLSRFYVIALLMLLMPVVWIAVFLTFPLYSYLNANTKLMEAELAGIKRIPDLEAKLENIDERLRLVSTATVTARLDALERELQLANLKPDEVHALASIQSDMSALKSYMFKDPNAIVEYREIQAAVQDFRSAQKDFATKESVNSSVQTLWNVFFVQLAFVGILFTVFLGSWWFAQRQAPEPTVPVSTGTPVGVGNDQGGQA